MKHIEHAEWLIFDELKLKDNNFRGSSSNLLITTTPCNKCTKRIINEFDFSNVYYLFPKEHQHKHELPQEDWKNISNIGKFSDSYLYKYEFHYDDIKYLFQRWNEANLQNHQKSLENHKQQS